MKGITMGRAAVVLLAAWGVLLVAAFVPPVLHRARHLCPVRPDGVAEAGAVPQWARKYGVSCSVCHTTVPRLTMTGYKFRRAGFRMPDEIGNETKFEGLKDLYSVRIREEFQVKGAATTSTGGKRDATNKFAFHELTFYPITGSIGKYWAAESELTFAPEENVEVENAYIRATYPVNDDFYLTARAGIFHPFEGYGGSDRPISNIRPGFQTNAAKQGGFDTKVKVWGQDQEGAEFGATYKDTTLTVAVLNGFNTKSGAANAGDDDNNRDFLFFFNQLIGDRAGVSAEYLNGKTRFGDAGATPADEALTITAGAPAVDAAVPATWVNNYQRAALYANYYVIPDKLNLLAGYGVGKDHLPNAVNKDYSDTFNNAGWYAEVESKLHEHFTGAVRYDTFKPSTRAGSNRISAVTFTAVAPFDWVKFLVDYQIKRTQRAAVKDTTDNIVRAEWMIIF